MKCMNTEGCLTLKYKDSVCYLGGFHVSRDGTSESDIETCFMNEGLIITSQKTLKKSKDCLLNLMGHQEI